MKEKIEVILVSSMSMAGIEVTTLSELDLIVKIIFEILIGCATLYYLYRKIKKT